MISGPHGLFIYGTLLPGQPQWGLLRRYATDQGWTTAVPGLLFDTGQRYPVAELWPVQESGKNSGQGSPLVHGRYIPILESAARTAWEALDRYEEVHLGLYQRLVITTTCGQSCWAYSLGPGAAQHWEHLEPIPSGDWVQHVTGTM
jgi:gamma-glutamylcyclotransferase (GGCT)/AIG2-like uncharacterized protein YtfP